MTSARATARASTRSEPPIGLPLLLASCLLLAACQAPTARLDPSGDLDVLAPFFAVNEARSGEWIVEGHPDVAPVDDGGSLRLQAGADRYAMIRRIDAPLLTSPYLGWAWNVAMSSPQDHHPVRLVVGFSGGNRQPPSWSERMLRRIEAKLPEYDRVLQIAWGYSALERGNLLPTGSPGLAVYVARGGIENAGRWWDEMVDLSSLYRRAWPDDDPRFVRIAFAGFVAEGGPQAAARFAAVALTR